MLTDVKDAVKAGDMLEEYDPEDYSVKPVSLPNACDMFMTLQKCQRFIEGFEGDELQSVEQLLTEIRLLTDLTK